MWAMIAMQIPVDIELECRNWGLDPALIAAVDLAEGGGERLIKAVKCSIPSVQDRAQAIKITCRTCTHAMNDYIKSNPTPGSIELFILFWAKRWAPEGADNDPQGLNKNWARNVTKIYYQLKFHPPGPSVRTDA